MFSLSRGLAAVTLACAALAGTPAMAAGALSAAKAADLAGETASAGVRSIADWAVLSGDHGGRPFVVVDKVESRLYVFDAQGRLRGASAALVGAARGDDSAPDIGSRPIAAIKPEERTTPAGRFTAVMGHGPAGEDILWVDYGLAIAIHRVVTHVPQERRLQRLQSKVAAERRITYGCINLPVAFYESVVRPAFADAGGIVYILPESRPVEDQFSALAVRAQGVQNAATAIPVSAH